MTVLKMRVLQSVLAENLSHSGSNSSERSFYEKHLRYPWCNRILEYITLDEKSLFSINENGYKTINFIKNVGYRSIAVSIALLAHVEWIARESIALVALTFSLLTRPINRCRSWSDKFFNLAKDVACWNFSLLAIQCGFYMGLFAENNELPHKSTNV